MLQVLKLILATQRVQFPGSLPLALGECNRIGLNLFFVWIVSERIAHLILARVA